MYITLHDLTLYMPTDRVSHDAVYVSIHVVKLTDIISMYQYNIMQHFMVLENGIY